MSPPVETGTIAVAAGSQLYLGGTVTFDVTFSPENLEKKHKGGVRIELRAYGPADPTTENFAMSRHHTEAFLLGGGWSPWQDQGGPAHCVAKLYYFNNDGSQTVLATVEFDAAASA